MAITLDASSPIGAQSSGKVTSFTNSMTLAGSNSMLIVGHFNNDNRTDVTCTWNGTSMTKDATSTDGTLRANIYSLGNPDTGTHNAVLTTAQGATDMWIYAANWNGLQDAAAEATSGTNGNSGTNTNTVTTIADNALHAAMMLNQNGNVQTASAGNQAVKTDATGTHGLYASSPYSVTPAGSNSLAVTFTSSLWNNAGASYAPYSGPNPDLVDVENPMIAQLVIH